MIIILVIILIAALLLLLSRPGRHRLVGRDRDGNTVELESRTSSADMQEIADDYLANGPYVAVEHYDGEELKHTYL